MPERGKKYIKKVNSFYAPAPSLATHFTLNSAGIWRVTVCPALDNNNGECRFIWPSPMPQESRSWLLRDVCCKDFLETLEGKGLRVEHLSLDLLFTG